MTEDQKYQGALYKEKPKKNQPQSHSQNKPSQKDKPGKMLAHQSYVEDAVDDAHHVPWGNYEGQTEDEKSPVEPLPEAPTPPAAAEAHVNVFDYLVATGQTPNASNTNLAKDIQATAERDGKALGRNSLNAHDYLVMADNEPMYEYGSGPIPGDAFVTPGAKGDRKKSKDGDKKDKKRKRLHVDLPGDQEMTDAPPVLHSGLTGGLKSLMRPVFPPSPDYSGGDGGDVSPASPLKKTKHSKQSKSANGVSNSIFDMITGGSKKSKKSKKEKHSRRHRDREGKDTKLIEYRPSTKDGKSEEQGGQMVLFKPRAELFLGFVKPDSDRGCSVNKALKRYHRQRKASGASSSKGRDEKELWRSLRLRKNDRGEIVLFSIDD